MFLRINPWVCGTLLMIFSATMSAPVETSSKTSTISPESEAEQIALAANKHSLVADSKLVAKIIKDVELIRKQNPNVSKVFNRGRKVLGKLEIPKYTAAMLDKINARQFGPAKVADESVKNTKSVIVSFPKNYNPDVLSHELSKLIGVHARPIWLTGHDTGDIQYKEKDDTYTFRLGLDKCKPNCTFNTFLEYKITDGKSKLVREFATDIPISRSRKSSTHRH